MKKLILMCSLVALVPLAGCVYRPYPYNGYYGDRYYGGYGDYYGDRYYGGSYGSDRYGRYGNRDRYRDSDGRDYRNRYGYDDDR